jgi:hypothetical protein
MQYRCQLLDRQPRPCRVNHAVAVSAQEAEICGLGLLAGLERVNGLVVMAYDEAFSALTVSGVKVKATAGSGESRLSVGQARTRRAQWKMAPSLRPSPHASPAFPPAQLACGGMSHECRVGRPGQVFETVVGRSPRCVRYRFAPQPCDRRRRRSGEPASVAGYHRGLVAGLWGLIWVALTSLISNWP